MVRTTLNGVYSFLFKRLILALSINCQDYNVQFKADAVAPVATADATTTQTNTK
jgi:hypothetical protein